MRNSVDNDVIGRPPVWLSEQTLPYLRDLAIRPQRFFKGERVAAQDARVAFLALGFGLGLGLKVKVRVRVRVRVRVGVRLPVPQLLRRLCGR